MERGIAGRLIQGDLDHAAIETRIRPRGPVAPYFRRGLAEGRKFGVQGLDSSQERLVGNLVSGSASVSRMLMG